MSVSEKRSLIESAHKSLSISRRCALIDLPRSSYYRPGLQGESTENLMLMRLIDEEYMRRPFYGARKIRNWLIKQGYDVNRKRVQRLMLVMGIESIAPKPNTSKGLPGTQEVPISVQGAGYQSFRSGVVFRYHLHSDAWRFCVSDGGHGLAQPLCTVLGSVGNHGR